MKKVHLAIVVASVVAHFAYLIYLPSGGFLALRWRRTVWLHVPTVCWGAAVASLDLPCPLTALEQRARAAAGMEPLPESGFVGRYVAGVVFPANRTGIAQSLAFIAAAVSWVALAVQRRPR
ncbi:hypothetical protein FHT40_001957 [Mycolicibacterium sp. BK556]|uniref:DUF2784 domain-containing protein n=1 Tax=unclassified Mycolicibacterium TaxID=2636767 RepID=UPI00160EC5BB|nr:MULTISPECIES: DUF2784 domain-containing protein [unclassified Mycolicibacterium]MBB3602324.1 hypothetical protein [Mycolicibacterium sp. BK556]MBB3632076.1 hypothetical protein [Mycolicibacterium sp. BK607]